MKIDSSTRGSALLIVLWAIAIMAVVVLGIVEYVNYDLDETIALKKSMRAYQLAESGINVGLNPVVKRGDKVLTQEIGPGEKFEVHLRSEGGRVNINNIIQSGQWDTLLNIFRTWGLVETDAVTVAESFKEWSKPDILQSPSPNAPPTPRRQFKSVDEMLLVPGMDIVAGKKPDWASYFTLWSDGRLDMNEAPADLIAAICGVDISQARRLVQTRLGLDEKPDTEDDIVFKNMEDVRQALGMGMEDFQKIMPRLNLQDSVARIESTGSLGTFQRRIVVVVRRNSSKPIYLQWQEF